MKYRHTHRPGFLFGLVDFLTAGLFFLLYMPLSGLQEELDGILGRKTPITSVKENKSRYPKQRGAINSSH